MSGLLCDAYVICVTFASGSDLDGENAQRRSFRIATSWTSRAGRRTFAQVSELMWVALGQFALVLPSPPSLTGTIRQPSEGGREIPVRPCVPALEVVAVRGGWVGSAERVGLDSGQRREIGAVHLPAVGHGASIHAAVIRRQSSESDRTVRGMTRQIVLALSECDHRMP